MSECPVSTLRLSVRGGVAAFAYGLFAYLGFLGTILYAIGFVGNLWVPKSIDSGPSAPLLTALTMNIALLALFAVQHSVMARPAFKGWWTRYVPAAVERSTYVILSSLALVLLFWQWRALPMSVWTVDNEAGRLVLSLLSWSGWATVFASTFLINHFELFGLKQVFARASRRVLAGPVFSTPLLYRMVRHPLYLGFVFAFWATPDMTVGHLLFALATTGYILVAIRLEERDLIAVFGDQYRHYQRDVPMLLPLVKRRSVRTPAGSVTP